MRQAKLFKNGRSQAVRLPKDFRMPGDSVYIRKVGNTVVLLPKKDSWEPLFEACSKFSSDFMSNRDQGDHERIDFFE